MKEDEGIYMEVVDIHLQYSLDHVKQAEILHMMWLARTMPFGQPLPNITICPKAFVLKGGHCLTQRKTKMK